VEGGSLAAASNVLAAIIVRWIPGASLGVAILAVVLALIVVWMRAAKKNKKKPRIRILPKGAVIIANGGPRICGGCLQLLENGSPLAVCGINKSHQIHDGCRSLTGGKCPTCGGSLK